MNRKLLLALTVSLAALVVVPGASSSSRLRGVIVKVDHGASTVAVARENGRVVLLRTSLASTAGLGQRVDVHHGRIAVVGHSTTTRLRGVVASTTAGSVALSANGVHLDLDRGAVTRPLRVGARVDLVVTIGDHLTIGKIREVEVENENEANDDDDDHATVVQQGGHGDDNDDEHGDDGDRGGNRGPGGGSGGGGGGDDD